MAVMEIKDVNRGNSLSTHLSAVADGIMVLGWVGVDNRPYKHIDESLSSAQFFGNRVQKEYKEKYVHTSWNFFSFEANIFISQEIPNTLNGSKPFTPSSATSPNSSSSIMAVESYGMLMENLRRKFYSHSCHQHLRRLQQAVPLCRRRLHPPDRLLSWKSSRNPPTQRLLLALVLYSPS